MKVHPRSLIPKKEHTRRIAFLGAAIITLITLFYAGFIDDRHGGQASPGSLTTTINQKAGTADSNPSYVSVFTVVFSEPIKKDSFTAADITLGGTATGQSVQSITEAGSFNATTFEVRIVATGAGTIAPSVGQELVSAINTSSGTNQASTSTDNSVTYNGSYDPGEFIFKVKTDNPGSNANNEFLISSYVGTNNYTVDCNNDGSPEHINRSTSTTCVYGAPGEYVISITGTMAGMSSYGPVGQKKVLDVLQWGTMQWETTSQMFEYQADTPGSFQISALDAPNLSVVTNMSSMFVGTGVANSFNSNINHWDTSNVVWMQSLFRNNRSYNQPLNNWNTSSVSKTDYMFYNANAFNQSLNEWDTGSLTTATNMFAWATAFNQSLASWDISSVTNLSNMFFGVGLSSPNYDATLLGWNTQPVNAVVFGAGASSYCDSTAARQALVSSGWTITDGGKICPLPDVTTGDASGVGETDATLSGTTTPKDTTQRGFQYGLTTSYGSVAQDGTSIPFVYSSKYGSSGSSTGQFSDPRGVAVDVSGNVYVADNANDRVQKFDAGGNFIAQIGGPGTGNGQFDGPNDVAFAADGSFYVTDGENHRVQKFDKDGNYINKWGVNGGAAGQFQRPRGITIDAIGNIYVADSLNSRVQKFDKNFNYISSSPGNIFAGGAGVPTAVAIDADNNIYVAVRSGANQVMKFDASWNLITQWGDVGVSTADGKFNAPEDIALDVAGLVYVADSGNHRVQIFGSNGNFLQKVGAGVGASGSGDGQFWWPKGLTLDYLGRVIVADSSNGRVQTLTGSISSGLSGLICNTTYHYRAYAVTSGGTGYGEDRTFVTGACSGDAFITTWKTDNPGVSASNQITIPTDSASTYNYSVDWGDGNTTTGETGSATHTYASSGTYTVKVTGTFPRIYFNYTGDKQKILTVEQWGTNAWVSMQAAFSGASNVTIAATDTPNLSGVTNLRNMFAFASSINTGVSNWDVSNVTDMTNMFAYATSFNSSINNWNVSSVTDMTGMFIGATSFNQPLDNWSLGNVDLSNIFAGASSFNQPLNSWNVSGVTNMPGVFANATSFNQPLNSWNVGNVTSMNGMFFGATSFNQSLSSWDVVNVTDMSLIFSGAMAFDQSLASWNVSNVVYMNSFFGAYMNVTPDAGLSTANYDATLIAWSSLSLQSNVTFDAGTSTYCNSATQRENIISTSSWVINDAGLDCSAALTATINQAANQDDPTSESLMNFTVVFSEAIDPATFTASDIWISSGSASVGTPATSDNITWNVPVTASSPGSISAELGFGAVATLDGAINNAATYTDNTVTYTLPQSDFSITKQLLTNGPIQSGDEVVYRMTIKNEGPNNSQYAGFIYDILPAEYSFIENTNPNVACMDMGVGEDINDPYFSLFYAGNHVLACMPTSPSQLNSGDSLTFEIIGSASLDFSSTNTKNRAMYFDSTNESSFFNELMTAVASNVDFTTLSYNNVASTTYVYLPATPSPSTTPSPSPSSTPTPTTSPSPTDLPGPTTTSSPNPTQSNEPSSSPDTRVSESTPSQPPARGSARSTSPTPKLAEKEKGTTSTNMFFGMVPEGILNSARLLPQPVARTLPFLLILVLFIIACLYARQAWLEYRTLARLQGILERYRNTQEASKNFVALTSHYLNTPVNILQASVELVSATKLLSQDASAQLFVSIENLAQDVKTLVADSQITSSHVADGAAQLDKFKIRNPFMSAFVIVPILVIGFASCILNALFTAADRYRLDSIMLVGQIAAFILAAGLLMLAWRSFKRNQASRDIYKQQVGLEHDLLARRVEFIEKSYGELSADVGLIQHHGKAMSPDMASAKPFFNAVTMLEAVLAKFESFIRFSKPAEALPAALSVRPVIEAAFTAREDAVSTKKLRVTQGIPVNVTARLDTDALNQLVDSLIDNAVKFSQDGGEISVVAKISKAATELVIKDTGIGIEPSKLSQLMTPFSRATDVMRFDYEGIGLSLYLDKVLLEQVGGRMTIQSTLGKGTTVTVLLPNDL